MNNARRLLSSTFQSRKVYLQGQDGYKTQRSTDPLSLGEDYCNTTFLCTKPLKPKALRPSHSYLILLMAGSSILS